MKTNFNPTLFVLGTLMFFTIGCKKHNDPAPHPHAYGVIPDTNRFAIPYTNTSTNGYTTFYYPYSYVISSEGNYQNGSPSGYWKQYYANGKLMKEGNYSSGQLTGNWKFYYPNGMKKEKGNYQNTVKSGTWKYYYDNGQLSAEGNYENGEKEGEWIYYNTDGTVKNTTPN